MKQFENCITRGTPTKGWARYPCDMGVVWRIWGVQADGAPVEWRYIVPWPAIKSEGRVVRHAIAQQINTARKQRRYETYLAAKRVLLRVGARSAGCP